MTTPSDHDLRRRAYDLMSVPLAEIGIHRDDVLTWVEEAGRGVYDAARVSHEIMWRASELCRDQLGMAIRCWVCFRAVQDAWLSGEGLEEIEAACCAYRIGERDCGARAHRDVGGHSSVA